MTFHRYYCDLKSRVAPFRTAEDFETIKTVASIDALADRADVIHRGNVPGWRFDRPEGLDEENLMRRAFLQLGDTAALFVGSKGRPGQLLGMVALSAAR